MVAGRERDHVARVLSQDIADYLSPVSETLSNKRRDEKVIANFAYQKLYSESPPFPFLLASDELVFLRTSDNCVRTKYDSKPRNLTYQQRSKKGERRTEICFSILLRDVTTDSILSNNPESEETAEVAPVH